MHVDGFRFDLASALARELHDVDRLSTFFDLVQQDPVVSQVKLIAEPWDVGEGGYQVGNFPPLWTEWNGKYRDTVRDFWRGQPATLPEFAYRLTGSSDLYEDDGRRPVASINFVTCHDGFTPRRPGELQRQAQRGATARTTATAPTTTAPGTAASRARRTTRRSSSCARRQQRNFLVTLFLSQGIPMMLCGDEIGRTQAGNNNAYCQDNEISWVDWSRAGRRAGPPRVHAEAGPAATAPPGLPPPPLLHGRPPSPRRLLCRYRLADPDRRRDDRGRLAQAGGAIVGGCLPQRVGDRPSRDRARRPGNRQEIPPAVSTRARTDRVHDPRGEARAPTGKS